MKYKLAFLIFPLSILMSCNYSFMVNKRNVVRNTKGYLVFRNEEVTFYPSKDTIDANFLSDKHKEEGYKVDFDTYWLDSLSTDYSSLLFVENDTKFSIIPVEIKYFLSDSWQKEDKINEIEYKLNNDIRTLKFKQNDWRYIIAIYLVRKTDREKVKNLHIDWGPSHYR